MGEVFLMGALGEGTCAIEFWVFDGEGLNF